MTIAGIHQKTKILLMKMIRKNEKYMDKMRPAPYGLIRLVVVIFVLFFISCENKQAYIDLCNNFSDAVIKKDLTSAQLISEKVSIERCNSSGFPLIMSVLLLKESKGYDVERKNEIIKWLLDNFKIDINYQRYQDNFEGVTGVIGQFITNDSQSTLEMAIHLLNDKERSVDINTIKLLIDNGADVNIRTLNKNSTPILVSVSASLEVFKLLIDSGADPNIENHQGISACKAIEFENRKEYYEYLIKKGIKCNY